MDDQDLERALAAVQRDSSGVDHCAVMLCAWLLVALGRHHEALEATKRASQAWHVNRAKRASRYGGSIFWEPWIARAAVALANGEWKRAEQCALEVLRDFDEHDEANRMWLLAKAGQGELDPRRTYCSCSDPAAELASFDLRAYALRMCLDDPLLKHE